MSVILPMRSHAARAFVYQVLALAAVVIAVALLAGNTLENMRARGIQSGFDFLFEPAGFDIGEAWLNYESSDAHWRALAVGVLNTLRVALVGIALTAVLGTLIGVGRFSRNALVRGACYAYVELFRNVPALLQLLMWYLLLNVTLPHPSEPLTVVGLVFLSKAGISLPAPDWAMGHAWALAGAVCGALAAWWHAKSARRRFEATGRTSPLVLPGLALLVIGMLVGWALAGAPSQWRLPRVGDMGVSGGMEITPEFTAVLCGLVFYTSAFVAENVRAGIMAVSRGQIDAANSLGLSPARQMRLIVIPQALRVIIPPVTNQFLNLTKNSSLAVAIGYPDVVSISNTVLNQTGRAVECIAIIMLVYLSSSLATSALMNAYNRRKAIKER